jgi:hypothetical protein
MARYQSDILDEACKQMLGHTNWAYADSHEVELMCEEREINAEDGEEQEDIAQVIIFYQNPHNEDEDED